MRRIPLQVHPISVGHILVCGIGRNASVCVVIAVRPVVAVPIVGYPAESLPVPEHVSVLPVHINMGIGGLRSWIVEDCAERSGRNLFGARRVNDVNVEILADDVGEYVVGMLSVRVFRNSVVRGGAVEFGIKQIGVSLAVIERCREQRLQPVVESLSVAGSFFIGIPASG